MTEFEKQLEEIKKIGEENKISVLNLDPHALWIMERADITRSDGKKWEYIPIEIIEDLLDHLYPNWSLELSTSRGSNEVAVNVKLMLPNTRFLSGIAALPIQSASEIEGIYQNAKSFAIKDAADHIGKLFGRDLNRGLERQKEVKPPTHSQPIAHAKNRAIVLTAIEKASTLSSLALQEKYREQYDVGDSIDRKRTELTNKIDTDLGF